MPSSRLASALPLQSHDEVSDAEAKARADFDIRCKVPLVIDVEDRPFDKSALQLFRAQLTPHEKGWEIFGASLRLAPESVYLKSRGMQVALGTTNILSPGAVKDTCNVVAPGPPRLRCGPVPRRASPRLRPEGLGRLGRVLRSGSSWCPQICEIKPFTNP